MKQFVSILAVLLCIGTANACMKKSPRNTDLTVIVMDTTQALLPNAEVKIQKQVFTTSFDGRVVLKPEQVTSSTFLVSCKGYKPSHAIVKDGPVLIVRLLPDEKKQKEGRGGSERYVTMVAKKGGLELGEARMMMVASPMADGFYSKSLEAASEIYDAASNGPVAAGRLTAGEVNDFAKWYFWPTVMDSTHKSFISTWKIAPRHRYSVLVKNQDGYPIASRAVSLLDQAGNTLFQAVTDNTGKAELWYQLVGEQLCGKHLDFYVRVDNQKQIAKQWVEGGNVFVLDEPCMNDQTVNAVDVVFVFDATGSMGDELRYLQEEMKDVISRAKEATGGLAIRTGAVVYRDHGYDEYLTRISRLTSDIAVTQSFIDKQSASGGGDYPEAVPEALMAALNSAGWNEYARTRIAFLILDAPCHEDSATIALLHEQILNAAALGVRIVPVVCSGIGESGEYLMRSIALATNGTSFFLTDDSGIGHTHLKPQTDSLKVEHLNDMMVRTIVEFSAMPNCLNEEINDEMLNDQMLNDFIPNPFSVQDLEADPTIPHGEGVHYLVDITGKLLGIFEGEVPTNHLPIGVYFIKTFYDGKWFTRKILVK